MILPANLADYPLGQIIEVKRYESDVDVLFGQRDHQLALVGVKPGHAQTEQLKVAIENNGIVQFTTDTGIRGVYTIVWDGYDDDASLPPSCTSIFNGTILLSDITCDIGGSLGISINPNHVADLTENGWHNMFALGQKFADREVAIIIRVWDINGNSGSVSGVTINNINTGIEQSLLFPFSNFGGMVDFTRISVVALQIVGSYASDVEFTIFETIGLLSDKNWERVEPISSDPYVRLGQTVQFTSRVFSNYKGPGPLTIDFSDYIHPPLSLMNFPEPSSPDFSPSEYSVAMSAVPDMDGGVSFTITITVPNPKPAMFLFVFNATVVGPIFPDPMVYINTIGLSWTLPGFPPQIKVVPAPSIPLAGVPEINWSVECPQNLTVPDTSVKTALFHYENVGNADGYLNLMVSIGSVFASIEYVFPPWECRHDGVCFGDFGMARAGTTGTIPLDFVLLQNPVCGNEYLDVFIETEFSGAGCSVPIIAESGLSLNVVSDQSGDVTPGTNITYEVTLVNTGTTLFTDIVLQTRFSDNVRLVSYDTECVGRVCAQTFSNVEPRTPLPALTYVVTVSDDAANGSLACLDAAAQIVTTIRSCELPTSASSCNPVISDTCPCLSGKVLNVHMVDLLDRPNCDK